ncbi:MAG TPA: L-aspartate oxidase [Acidimicrobiales bacterium]|nr:L-aspartate oxidase [Acidimicrobiales bacterium]
MTYDALRYLPAAEHTWRRETDIVIIGAGAAGLSAALDASRRGHRVIVLSKGSLRGGSTPLAQGGLAAVMGSGDSLESHVADTLVAGAGLADERTVRELVAGAPGAVQYLASLGARFDVGPLGLEGGHSHRRIVHAGGDAIGAELHRVLRRAVKNSDVEAMENTVAIDAIKNDQGDVIGVVAGRVSQTSDRSLEVGIISARAVVIATGGLGQAFASSTNPADVTGDGIALAARAGAEITNIEFIQFHPTVLHRADQRGQSPLITEAIRGAGAHIVDDTGTRVMEGKHDRGDLAPRDVVSYTMFQHMHRPSEPLTHLWLDARSIGESRLIKEFPTTTELCRLAGFDPASVPIPIAPGAHYSGGGIRADLDGNSSVRGLYAIGEAASTGVHGANRLASNSLTEALISGRRLARQLDDALVAGSNHSTLTDFVGPITGRGVDAASREPLATTMSAHAGVDRTRTGLEGVLDVLEGAPDGATTLDLATLEATNLHTVSLFVARAAVLREESRGCHRRSDFSETSDQWAHSVTLRVRDGAITTDLGTLAGA